MGRRSSWPFCGDDPDDDDSDDDDDDDDDNDPLEPSCRSTYLMQVEGFSRPFGKKTETKMAAKAL